MLWILLLMRTYTARVEGSVRVYVQCECCKSLYSYRLEEFAVVSMTEFMDISERTKDEAHDRAEDKLDEKLETGCDTIPCPECGDYQPQMVEQIKIQRFRYLLRYQDFFKLVAMLSACSWLLFTLIYVLNRDAVMANGEDPILFLLFASGLATIFSLILWAYYRRKYAYQMEHYDPNHPEKLDDRLEIADEWARKEEIFVARPTRKRRERQRPLSRRSR